MSIGLRRCRWLAEFYSHASEKLMHIPCTLVQIKGPEIG